MDEQQKRRKSTQILSKAEEYIYIAAGFILVIAAAGLLVAAIIEISISLKGYDYSSAIVQLLDRILLVLMLAEIIYTVQRIAHTRRLEATPFLVIGIIAAIRRMLIITAESANTVNLDDAHFQGALAELGLLAVLVLLLAISVRLIHNCNRVDKKENSK
ncbi:MAG: phosphate-starvation-inducible PsiE family protein [Thiohalophilus sp.]|jgi:uncharacterized membrane protein (DUF373 family)